MQKTDYSNFDLGDFAADQYFVEWVLRPDLQSDAFWAQWQTEHPAQEKLLHEARLTVLLMQSRKIRMQEHQKENLWQKIQQETTEKSSPAKRTFSKQVILYAAAACLAIFALAFVGLMYSNSALNGSEVIAENPSGKTSIIYLQDGTKVWLNAESRLSYQKSFDDASTRTVTLEGEAFFDVAEDKNKPFIVHARQMQVKVLGTAFNVKAFATDNEFETTLVRGRVEASSPGSNTTAVILAPNQQAVWDEINQRMSVLDVKADEIAAWRDGILIFDNTPFSEVKLSLERRYGVKITLADESSLNCHFSGIVKDEPITKVLELLKTTSKITYEIDGATIRLNGSLCQRSSPSP